MLRSMVLWGWLAVVWATVSFADDPPVQEPPEWRAGIASAVITPEMPLPMSGYAGRKEPAEGAEQDLFAKALVIEDRDGNRAVMLTMDLIGVIDRLRATVAEQVEQKYGLPPASLLMNASHTHCGPAYGRDEAKDYFDRLAETLVALVGQAIDGLQPVTLDYCQARCGFAMNRRTPTEAGYKNHPNPMGTVDHTVPVLRVGKPDGELLAVVFGYACHNTTMGFLRWLGDYAGYAQEYFQTDHPGVTAMFMMGCSADQNPYPRRELHYAQRHGRSLATAVEAALEVDQRAPLHYRPLHAPLRSVMETVHLDAASAGRDGCDYPVQVIRFGNDLALITLGEEVVVDYGLRLKSELNRPAGPAIWVAGYSNSYDHYIATKKILEEGGYEANCCPWKPDLEERIIGKAHELFERSAQP